MKLLPVSFVMLSIGFLFAEPVLHSFELWDTADKGTKILLYVGWTNGFHYGGRKPAPRLIDCIQTISNKQAIAMIDLYYKGHPEKWSRPFSEQILAALVIPGGPCESVVTDAENGK